MDRVGQFKKDCYANYLPDIQRATRAFPRHYVYPDGNPIRPVLPIQESPQNIMVIGAFPSARFERREGRLIPVGDNLSPFGKEAYFDGHEVRIQESAHRLETGYLQPLRLNRERLWITDIVKVYLYPEKHLKNCRALFPRRRFVETHKSFAKIATASRDWLLREIAVCNPRLVITLGVVCARVLSSDRRSTSHGLLDGRIRPPAGDLPFATVYLAHPEIRRTNHGWDSITEAQITALAPIVKAYT